MISFLCWKKNHSAEGIAQILHLHPQNTAHILNALVAFNLIWKDGDIYNNSPIANEFLVSGKPTYLGDYLRTCDPWYAISPEMICKLVREGPKQAERDVNPHSENFLEMQTRGSINYQRSGMAHMVVRLVSSLPEYSDFNRMLDLGCGPGLLGIALALDHPTLNVILFDKPDIINVAERCVLEYGVSDRVTTMAGNYLNDSFGDGYDLILASMTLNYALGSFDRLMKKIYEGLNHGGVCATLSDGRTQNGSKPEEIVISMLLPDLLGQNMAIGEDFIANAMFHTGFHRVRTKMVQSPIGELEWTIGKK
ncbi:methyltransferase domain-containing protein [Methanospirillum sp. J.3.6.1-F.2.7.3]|uniref:Methyltransferase domain-containing protein n=1 Tax=Methanospirillum purgamenti TaxID=2834276 RepID=A0A8E7B3M8_9EURY|nr:methyltransferase domain-containing protein [Methanospirillum sp. J.3.6.1-F.2.7.3]